MAGSHTSENQRDSRTMLEHGVPASLIPLSMIFYSAGWALQSHTVRNSGRKFSHVLTYPNY